MLLHARTVENSLPDKPMRFVTRGAHVNRSMGFERAALEGEGEGPPGEPATVPPQGSAKKTLSWPTTRPEALPRGKDKSL